jgi:small-conductance mechanosensitive channel
MLSWGINVTAWIASAGILSVVIGFAAKDTLGNLFAGIFIMADSPYKEGDYINLDTGERGYVRDIGIRSTRIQTRDDIEITIPNSVIANSKIINESGGPHEKERIRITIDVAYGSIIEDVKSIMNNIAQSSDSVCQDPAPRVRFREFGESGIRFQLLAWIEKPELRGRVIDELSTEIYNSFNSNNIEIPFPQRTIHIKKQTNN